MQLSNPIKSPTILLYSTIFVVTQVTGLLLSLTICFILQDFIAGFVRMALINSFILGLSLIGSCWFTQTMMFRMKVAYIMAISFSLILGVGIISTVILLVAEPTLFIYYDRGAFSFLIVNFLFIIALHIISSGLIIYREILLEKEKTIGNERYLKNQMGMKLLSSKVNPHFLFNTLNMIISLLKQPEKAEDAILNLSDLLRHNLEQSERKEVPVGEEIENVRKYLELQRLRFGDKLDYSINANADFPLPPLVIQPLVENCIKHNIRNVAHLSVQIAIVSNESGHIVTIADSERKVDPSMLDRGQGLTITRKRVENAGGTFSFKNGGIAVSFPR